MKARQLLRVLARAPLNYSIDRQSGSHMRLKSESGFPDLTFAFHANQTLPGGLVRKVLVAQVGLSYEEARRLV